MENIEFQKFVVSQKGMIIRGGKCLILQIRLDRDQFGFQKWDLPGGRINEGEEADAAFKREIEEETGLKDFKDLGLVDYLIRYPINGFPPFCALIHLLEIGQEEIKLSYKHCEMKWISEKEIDEYIYCWGKMPEMIKRGFKFYKKLK
jgi:8-oxo-dGTP pyrophosphatase MutT (NUDIX family)